MDRSNCYHASAALAWQGKNLTLQVIVPDGESDLIDLFLFWQAEHAGRIRMLPADGLSVWGESYTVYAATVKGADLTGDTLTYYFAGDFDPGVTETYTVPLRTDVTPPFIDGAATWPMEGLHPSAILPLSPTGRAYLSQGDLPIRFATAGEYPEVPVVYVRQDDGFVALEAVPARGGYYRAVVPYTVLARLKGRLYYYIAVSGGGCTVSLGSEKRPLSVRLVDNTGPLVTDFSPADGQCLQEPPAEIRIAYEDVSGVNAERSILCLDGQNISKGAEWGEKSVIFTPDHPLLRGTHTVEAVLRDRRGNHTYHRFDFTVGDGTPENARPKPTKARSISAALFLANAFSTLKNLFSVRDE